MRYVTPRKPRAVPSSTLVCNPCHTPSCIYTDNNGITSSTAQPPTTNSSQTVASTPPGTARFPSLMLQSCSSLLPHFRLWPPRPLRARGPFCTLVLYMQTDHARSEVLYSDIFLKTIVGTNPEPQHTNQHIHVCWCSCYVCSRYFRNLGL